MSDTKLPNPIPAGTVAFVPDTKGVSNDLAWVDGKRYRCIETTTPVHILSDDIVEAVRRVQAALLSPNPDVRDNAWGQLTAAFPIPPQETGKEVPKTLVERAMALRSPDGSLNPTVQWNDSVLLDALSVIDAIRAELKEVRNGR